MSRNRFATDIDNVLERTLQEADGELFAVNLSRSAILHLVEEMEGLSDRPSVKLLADPDPVKTVMGDFIVASHAADLVADGALAIRELDAPPNHSLLIADRTVQALVETDSSAAALGADEQSFVTETRSYYRSQWEDASGYNLRTPPLSRVQETLAEDIGAETAADFDAVLSSFETARGNGDGLDEVTISILVAARNGELLYDISKWGEDIGLASKATFSRTKTRLEDVGAIDTEKVPIDVGRPRLRLRLADDRLREAEPSRLGHEALSLLAE
jgi:hypothetical protein